MDRPQQALRGAVRLPILDAGQGVALVSLPRLRVLRGNQEETPAESVITRRGRPADERPRFVLSTMAVRLLVVGWGIAVIAALLDQLGVAVANADQFRPRIEPDGGYVVIVADRPHAQDGDLHGIGFGEFSHAVTRKE